MLKPPQSNPILSPQGASGATLYNSYYFFTQLSALYAGALEWTSSDEERGVWIKLSDGTLADIEKLYHVWEWQLAAIKSGAASSESSIEWSLVALACRRMTVIHRCVNLWTPRHQWARICSLSEYRWQKILRGFQTSSDDYGKRLTPLHHSSVGRQNLIDELVVGYRRHEISVNQWFSGSETNLEVDLSSAGSPRRSSSRPTPQRK